MEPDDEFPPLERGEGVPAFTIGKRGSTFTITREPARWHSRVSVPVRNAWSWVRWRIHYAWRR